MFGMIHQRQRLPLGLEAGDHLPRVHARLDDLQGHLAAHRLLLLGDEHQPEAPLADLLHELVGTDDCARSLEWAGSVPGDAGRRDRLLKEFAQTVVGQQQGVDVRPEVQVALARPVQVGASLFLGRQLEGFAEYRSEVGPDRGHRLLRNCSCLSVLRLRPNCASIRKKQRPDGWLESGGLLARV